MLTRQSLASICGRAAHEVLSFIRAPAAFVLGHLRIREQRTGPDHFAASVPVLRHELVRGRAFLDPPYDRLHPADRRGARATEPVIDARREKQASKPPDLLPATHPL